MRPSKSKARTLVALQFLLLLLLVINPLDPLFEVERIISLTCYLFATLILASAAVALGSALTASPIPRDDAELVTRGIYRRVRHPMYSALLLMGVGLLLANFNLFSIITYLALIGLLLEKSRFEDSLLATRHREAERYQASTGRFFPKF